VFISDGVVEARDRARSLYGFNRVQQALAKSQGADAIAGSAQRFGQEDDITVVVISRKSVEAVRLPQPQPAPMAV
jgi:serine phosphatase RsbU (regulator of sigma subunit)